MIDLSQLAPGRTGSASQTVTASHTAATLGSGTLEVFATPAMIALMEAAAVDCVERALPPGTVSLGIHVDVSHEAATPPGTLVTATAELVSVTGRELEFRIEARDTWQVIGRGRHTRVVVDAERFLGKVRQTAPDAAV